MSKIIHTYTSNPTLFGSVVTEFSYDSESPFEINMTFNVNDDPILWRASIETLLEAARIGHSGEGDIIISKVDDSYTITLSNGREGTTIYYDSDDINEFIMSVRAVRGEHVRNWKPFTDETIKELFS